MLEQRARIPVEQRNYEMFYIVFSAILFLGTVWAVWDEVSVRRPWKGYQSQYYALLYQKLDSLKTAAVNAIDSTEAESLRQRLKQAQDALGSDEYVRMMDQKNGLLKDLDVATRNWRFARSRSDAAFYQYQQALLTGKDTTSSRAEVHEYEAAIAKYAAEMDELQKRIADFNEIVDKYEGEIARIEVERKKLFASADAYNLKLERAEKGTLEIKQVMLPDFELTPFSEVKARIDRCQTCHLGWNESVMAEAPQPFKSHPTQVHPEPVSAAAADSQPRLNQSH